MATIYGNTASSYWRTYLTYTSTDGTTGVTISFSYGIYISKELHKDHTYTKGYDTTYVACTGQTTKYFYPSGTLYRGNCDAGNHIQYGSGSFTVAKSTSGRNVSITAYVNHTKSYAPYMGVSSVTGTVWVGALPYYTATFNANGGVNPPSSIGHYYNSSATIPTATPTKDGYEFIGWATSADTQTVNYYAGGKWSENQNRTLYAVWGASDPPTFDVEEDGITFTTNGVSSKNIVKGFTTVSVAIENVSAYTGRSVESITLHIGDATSSPITTDGTMTISDFSLVSAGEYTMYVETEDNATPNHAVGKYDLATVLVVEPTWSKEVVVLQDGDHQPRLTQEGYAILDSLKIYNYTTASWDEVQTSGLALIDHSTESPAYWGFNYSFDADHVSRGLDNELIAQPNVNVKVSYRHFDETASDTRTAFFATTRNQNYSNGIYNVMFVGGCDNKQFPDFASRIWWCKINNPLYFPDTNYLEVGSNDTAVQGLTKVGDYLGVVKQSKTTDTAIFLVYPTSFEEETTYAVKQGVQGVGALAKYSFNILGDETLFLSPHGIMAIVPTEDMEHKVQNRSYFVDKQMLAESGIENSYSFVHDGKYYLAIGTGKGAVYVLDGNQRNSWGNDKTNLVYECYYLENIPANCFVKYDDKLVFSTANEVCIFSNDYYDAYDNLSGDTEVPVKAEWSTIFDDDGALHYYKTMQKKGNLVSILPMGRQLYYIQAIVTEDEFDENKTLYWTFDGENYIQCTENDEWDENTTYYIQHRSATKVLVRKDDKEPVEIQRTFGVSSAIPSELFINKKFKKYKRLQFILRNEEAEDFGVDEIVKNYTVGNYAKK